MASRRKKATPEPSGPVFVTFKKGSKPSKAAGTDLTRPTLCNGFLRKTGNGWEIVATDSYVLARLPVTVECENGSGPVEGAIPLGALKAAEKDGAVRVTEEHAEPCDRAGIGRDVLYKRTDPGDKVPNWDEILKGPERKRPVRIGLNPQLLLNLAEALGSKSSVYLTIDAEKSLLPIKVEAPGKQGDGVIMPIRIYED